MNSCRHEGAEDDPGTSELALPQVARLRQLAHRFFAALFLYPEQQRLDELATMTREMRLEDDYTFLFPFSGAWEQLLFTLAELSEIDKQEIEKEYRQLFLAVADSPACPLYESHYRTRPGQDNGWVTGQLIQRYKEAGLALAPTIEQTPDHVSVELEFMAFLCANEALAWQGAVTDSGMRALKRQRAFLRRNLNEWLPVLTSRIINVNPDGFYAQVAGVTAAFIHHEMDLIELILVSSDEAAATVGGSQHAS